MEDQEMIDLYFARNEDAIAYTAAAYGKRLFALAEHIVRNQQDAEENVSDTYRQSQRNQMIDMTGSSD